MAAGASPAGLGARDTLRLESGLPLHGHELGPGITPLEAGLSWVVAWDKPGGFTGLDALVAQRHEGLTRVLRGIAGEGRQPLRAGYAARLDGVLAGELTSGNYSPVLGCGIGMGFLQLGLPDGAELEVDARGRVLTCHIVPPTIRQEIRYNKLMAHFVPHTDDDFARMLGDLGLSSPAELFECIPEALRLAERPRPRRQGCPNPTWPPKCPGWQDGTGLPASSSVSPAGGLTTTTSRR